MVFLLFIFNEKYQIPSMKRTGYLPVLILIVTTNQIYRGTIIGANYETQYLVQYNFTIESVDCHSIHALFLDGNQPSQSRPSRDGFAI